MPHQCTACGHTFEDGSKEMLGGCPDCGGNKFQFYPEGTDVPEEPSAGDEPPEPPEPEGSAVASKVGRATNKVRDFVSSGPEGGSDPGQRQSGSTPDSEPTAADRSAATSNSSTATSEQSTPTSDQPTDTSDQSTTTSDSAPDPNAPWPDSSDAADPIRKGGFESDADPAGSSGNAPGSSDDATVDDSATDATLGDEDDIIDAEARATERALGDAEDAAQSDARRGLASDAEVDAATDGAASKPDTPETPATDASAADTSATGTSADTPEQPATSGEAAPADGTVVDEPSEDEPDLSELREQLNDQFESIKILEPGQYELNLMELYDREEYIIALQENGRYVIQVPENFMGDHPGE